MSNKADILVIGAGPAGMISAGTARRYYPDKKITVLKSIEKGVIPCGIPYMFSSLKNFDDNMLATTALEEKGIEVVVGMATNIDRKEKIVTTDSNKKYSYEKLVIAVGSAPIVPKIPGVEKKGVFPIQKDMDYLKKAIQEIRKGKNILIVGGGFIGVEFADEISKVKELNVSLIEMLPNLLANSFDEEFSEGVEEKLRKHGVNILTGRKVIEFLGEDRVTGVRLENNEEIEVDGVGADPTAITSFS